MKIDNSNATKKQLDFPFLGARTVRAVFDAEHLSSDGGAIFLPQIERGMGLLKSITSCFIDSRDPRYIDHSIEDLVSQRAFQIALGYEDCNDADTLRFDPVLKACCGRDPENGADLGSQPTLSRLENAADSKTCYRIANAFIKAYLARHKKQPKHLILDIDTTEDRTYGDQQLSFFNTYYGHHVYLPLLIFDQDGDLIAPILFPGKTRQNEMVAAVLERVLRLIRARWPNLRILLRADSEFAAPAIYDLVEKWKLEMLLGIAGNSRLKKLGEKLQGRAWKKFLRREQKVRLFTSTRYRALKGWPRGYRVVIKAEHSVEGTNLRFVITNLPGRSEKLYDRYTERGESCENSIKDLKNALKADRLSCSDFLPNQFRLFLHGAAYILMYALRQAARGTEFAVAQMDTLRLKLLKIGARVRVTTRRIWFHLSESYPWQKAWSIIAGRLASSIPFG